MKLNDRDIPQLRAASELRADKPRRPIERLVSLVPNGLVAQNAEVDPRGPKVRCHLRIGDGYETDTGILELPLKDHADLLNEKLPHASLSGCGHDFLL